MHAGDSARGAAAAAAEARAHAAAAGGGCACGGGCGGACAWDAAALFAPPTPAQAAAEAARVAAAQRVRAAAAAAAARVLAAAAPAFGLAPGDLALVDLFVVVYDENGQRELAPHTDGCLVSFNILLSDPADFDGGGTHFLDLAPPDDPDADPAIARDAQARAANPPDTGIVAYSAQGDAVVHSAKLTHAARPVVRGQRLVLVGFADTPGPRADQKADAAPPAAAARSVYLISVKEGFDDARLDDAITAVTQAGGSVLQRFSIIPAIKAELPNDKFKTLSALAFVDVELDGPVHIAGGN